MMLYFHHRPITSKSCFLYTIFIVGNLLCMLGWYKKRGQAQLGFTPLKSGTWTWSYSFREKYGSRHLEEARAKVMVEVAMVRTTRPRPFVWPLEILAMQHNQGEEPVDFWWYKTIKQPNSKGYQEFWRYIQHNQADNLEQRRGRIERHLKSWLWSLATTMLVKMWSLTMPMYSLAIKIQAKMQSLAMTMSLFLILR